jgi:hypothetical protein
VSPQCDQGRKPLCSRGPNISYSPPPFPLTVAPQVQALWMTASERVLSRPQFNPSTRRTPSSWDDIPAINFSPHGINAISPASVTCAVEVRQVALPHLRFGMTSARRCWRLFAINPQPATLSSSHPLTPPQTYWGPVGTSHGPRL